MPDPTRESSRACVRKGLKAVADFTGDFETFTFAHWHDFHKTVFINVIAACVSRNGHRVVLNESMIDMAIHPTLESFVDHVYDHTVYIREPDDPLTVVDDDLAGGA